MHPSAHVRISGYLFGDIPREHFYRAFRLDHARVRLNLPSPLDLQHIEEYEIPFDERDQRDLFVFDGTFLPGGLPRSAQIIHSSDPFQIAAPVAEVYRARHAYEPTLPLEFSEQSASLTIRRHVLLLPSGKSLICCFNVRNLAPQYALVTRTKTDGVLLRSLNSY